MDRVNRMTILTFIGWAGIWTLVAVGVTLSTLHMINQLYPSANATMYSEFVKTYLYGPEFFFHVLELWVYPLQLWIHVFLGIGYLLVSPLQFMPTIRRNYPMVHRTAGWISIFMGVVLCCGGMLIVVNAAYVGLGEQVTIFLVAFSYFFMVFMALKNIRSGNVAKHREWMIFAFAMMLAVIGVRPWYVMFLNLGLPSREVFIPSMWLSTIVSVTIASAWIMFTRKAGAKKSLGA